MRWRRSGACALLGPADAILSEQLFNEVLETTYSWTGSRTRSGSRCRCGRYGKPEAGGGGRSRRTPTGAFTQTRRRREELRCRDPVEQLGPGGARMVERRVPAVDAATA